MKTPRLLLTIIALACVPAFAQLGANPRYIPEIQIGTGYAGTGMDIEADGDMQTKGSLTLDEGIVALLDADIKGGDLSNSTGRLDLKGTAIVRVEENTFEVYDSDGATSAIITSGGGQGVLQLISYRTSTPRGVVRYSGSNGTLSAATTVASSQIVTRMEFEAHDGTGFVDLARIDGMTDSGTIGTNDMPGELQFSTTPDGSATPVLGLTINSDQTVVTAGDVTGGDDVIATDDYQSVTNLDLVPASTYAVRVYEDGGTVAATFDTAGDLALGNYLTCADGIHVRLKPTSGEDIRLYEDGGAVAHSVDTAGILQSVFDHRPTVSLTPNLGSSSFRWGTIYSGAENTSGNSTFGDASTDTNTFTGRMIVRSVTDAGPMTATGGSLAEIVWNTSNSKFYGCSVAHASAATWVAFH